MAAKTLTVIRAGLYGTRMLKAGDTFDATGSEARLFEKLGWMKAKAERKVETKEAPKAPRKRRAKKTA